MTMEYNKSGLNTVKRGAKRASYNKKEIEAILDATSIGQIAFLYEGKAYSQPINYGRKGETLYIHGSHQNRMTNALLEMGHVSMNVTLFDGMILTKSAFHHSVNYRSAVIFGNVRELKTNNEKLEGLKVLINHFVPNRWEHCRIPTENELKGTRVLAIDITSASAKIKNTPPADNEEDKQLPHWSGTIPITHVYEQPITDVYSKDMPIPDHVKNFVKQHKM